MPRQLFFLHTSQTLLLKVPPPAQTQWLRRVRQFFASGWKDDDAATLPSAFVLVPRARRTLTPASTYGAFQQAIFPSVPWMPFQRASVWGTTRLDADLSREFWQLTKRPDHGAIDLMFVLLRDPTMPMPLKHPEWIIHGYPKWPGMAAARRPLKPASRAALPPYKPK